MTTVYENEKHRLTIIQDDDATNPREWDNIGHMVCYHKRYHLGDEQASRVNDYRSWEDWLQGEVIGELDEDDFVILNLYLYDHSGITMSTESFSSRWDSGQVGFIYAKKDDFIEKAGFSGVEDFDEDKAIQLLKGEVKEYDQYLTGQVYGYTIEEKKTCECCGHTELTEVDSCWGFFADSEDEVIEVIKDQLALEHKTVFN